MTIAHQMYGLNDHQHLQAQTPGRSPQDIQEPQDRIRRPNPQILWYPPREPLVTPKLDKKGDTEDAEEGEEDDGTSGCTEDGHFITAPFTIPVCEPPNKRFCNVLRAEELTRPRNSPVAPLPAGTKVPTPPKTVPRSNSDGS